jgi:hypothetical protein
VMALGWISLGAWQAVRLLRRSQESPPWMQQELAQIAPQSRLPKLRVSQRVATAVALCASRPHIVLPASSIQQEDATGVRAALAHEWAHIRNGDLWLLALERLLLPVFFWHPLFWLFRRRIRFDQELLADAAAAGEQPVEYAEALLAWAKLAITARPPLGMAALSLWESPHSLTRRVEMILQGNKKDLTSPSRPWRFIVLTSLLAAVLGLSLVTLRPTASAQDDGKRTEAKQRQRDIPRKKKNKPARDAEVATAAKPTPQEAAIELSMQVLEVDQRKLADAGVSFDELVINATGERCQMIEGVIVAANEPKPLDALIGRLKDQSFATILSTPKVITLDRQEATVQIGIEVPLVEIEETVNGQSSGRIEYKNAGIHMTIKPSLNTESAELLTLEVAIERSRLLPPRKDADGESPAPVFKTQRLRIATDVALNQAVLLAEPQPKHSKKDDQGTLLIVIAPARISAPRAATAAHPPLPLPDKIEAALAKLSAENDELRKQVAHLQKQLGEASVQATAPAAKAADSVVKVFALRETPARRVMEVIEQLKREGKTNIELKAIAPDERTNSIIVSGKEQELVIVGNVIAALDKAVAPAAEPSRSGPEKLAERLRALDVREAEIKLRAAQTNLERLRANSAAVPEQDLLGAQFEVDKAVLELESIKSGGDPLVKQKLEVRLAEVRLRSAQIQLERLSAVVNQGGATRLEFDAAQFEVGKAKIDLERAKAKLEAISEEAVQSR